MKRTNLVLDEQILETATRLLGKKTYSATVNWALQEVIKLANIRQLENFFGQSVWEGDLPSMREDSPPSGTKNRQKKR